MYHELRKRGTGRRRLFVTFKPYFSIAGRRIAPLRRLLFLLSMESR